MKEVKLKSATGHEYTFTTDVEYDTKLIISLYGLDGAGKSRFAVTGPTKNGLVAIVPTDRKTRKTVLKTMDELGKRGRIIMPKEDLVREVNPSRIGWSANATDVEMEKKTKEHYRKHVDKVKEITWALHAHKDVTLICIDLFQQFYQDLKYAHYGRTEFVLKKINQKQYYKDTKEADQELIDFINSISDKHLVLTHKSKDEYVNDTNTGKQQEEGYKYIGNHVNMRVELVNNPKWKADSEDENKSWHFGLSVRKCQDKIELEGEAGHLILKDEWISFQLLARCVFPNADPDLFE